MRNQRKKQNRSPNQSVKRPKLVVVAESKNHEADPRQLIHQRKQNEMLQVISTFLDGRGKKLGVNAPMGLGKSEVVKKLAIQYQSRGVIIVVERRGDMARVCNEINEEAKKTLGTRIAKPYWRPNMKNCQLADEQKKEGVREEVLEQQMRRGELCRECLHLKCKSYPEKVKNTLDTYPVVLITHSYLKHLLMNKKGISKLIPIGDAGNREIMLIDERPYMFDSEEITLEDVGERLGSKRHKDEHKILKLLKKIAKKGDLRFSGQKEKIEFKPGDNETRQTLLKLWQDGGIVVESPRKTVIKLAKHHPLQFKLIKKTIVFDGSMGVDPHYPLFMGDTFPVKSFVREEEGKIRLHIWNQQKYITGFKRLLRTKPETIRHILVGIKEEHPDEEVLVVTTKKRRKRIRAFEVEGIKVVHFGALKGRNDLRNFGAIYLTHIHQFPVSSYLSMAVAAGMEISTPEFGMKQGASGRFGFRDQKLERLRVQSIVAGLMQDIYRTRVRDMDEEGKVQDIDVYFGLVDPSIITAIKFYYLNIKIQLLFGKL